MRKTSRLCLLGIAAVILGGCASAPLLSDNEPAYPTGTVLRLAVPITIPAQRSGVWLGKGPIVIAPERDEIVCRLEARRAGDRAYTIHPDRLTVLGVRRDRENYASAEGAIVPVGFPMHPGIGSDTGWILVNTYIYLRSENQPQVQRLKCQQARDDFGLGILTPADLAPVLEGYLTVAR